MAARAGRGKSLGENAFDRGDGLHLQQQVEARPSGMIPDSYILFKVYSLMLKE